MKKLQIYSVLTLFAFSIILINACKKDAVQSDSIEGLLEMNGQFEQPVTMQETLATSTSEKEGNGMQWTCETTDYSIQDGAGGNEGFPLFSPNASVIYPGSLLQGGSLNDATPNNVNRSLSWNCWKRIWIKKIRNWPQGCCRLPGRMSF